VVAIGLFGVGLLDIDFLPARILPGLLQLGNFLILMVPPNPGTAGWIYLQSLAETLGIALLGTLIAAVLAFPMALLATRQVLPVWLVRFVMRRSFDTIRGIDTLIWALIWISVVGLGPFAGVLAIASSDFGAFGKLFSEAIEAVDRKAVEGIRAAGGTRLDEIRFGLIPLVLPVIAGQVLYYIESNTRSATIIGIVGAGGIGLHLAEEIRTLEWQHVSFLILLILLAVGAIDLMSSRLRAMLMGGRDLTHG
jgi:phosphonate transport system permease protein